MMRPWRITVTSITLIALLGCDGGAFSGYSNYDLQQAWQECKKGGLSAAGAQRCKNIQSECEARLKASHFRC